MLIFILLLLLLLLLFFIYLHLSTFFILLMLYLQSISSLLCHVTGTPHWLLRPVKVSTNSELYPDYFRLAFHFHLLWVLRFWVSIFYPQTFFTLHSSLTFCHNLLLSRFHREPAVTFLKVAGLHTDLRNTDLTDLFVWFTVIHNLLNILNLYLCMSIAIAKVLLVVKTLIKKYKSAAMKI